jgi:hypothetical protein
VPVAIAINLLSVVTSNILMSVSDSWNLVKIVRGDFGEMKILYLGEGRLKDDTTNMFTRHRLAKDKLLNAECEENPSGC